MKIFKSYLKPVLLVTLLFVLSQSACKKGWLDWLKNEPDKKPPISRSTSVTGSMVRVICGVSIYDNLWIKTDEGKYLQPCEQSFLTFAALYFKEGDRVKVDYRPSVNATHCDTMITCTAINPVHQRVIIDAINKIPDTNCSPIQIVNNYSTITKAQSNIMFAEVQNNCLRIKMGFSGCDANTKRFQVVCDGTTHVLNGTPTYLVKITDINPQMCQAYFEDEISCDISAFKRTGSVNNMVIKLDGYTEVIKF
ncbi:MAG: hypothetical protein Q8M15_01060 [Bacteroidota bacterium]|nr:hypothetical protein [Bacteroidota bacterium]